MIHSALLTGLFFVFSGLEIYAEIIDLRILIYLTKPAAIGMILIAALQQKKAGILTYRWYIPAVIFGMIGDAILMMPSRPFVFGLIAFLIGHVFYVLSFREDNGPAMDQQVRNALTGVVLVFLFAVTVEIWPHLGKLRIPVTAYLIVSLGVAVSAMQRGAATTTRYLAGAMGAFLFVISDSAIAANRFVEPFDSARWVIMSTYLSGQYLLAVKFLTPMGGKTE